MTRTSDIYALDLGTTKFCFGVLKSIHDKPSLTVVDVPAAGMRRGMLSDFSLAKEALENLILKTESQLNIDIRKIVVGVAGSHLQGRMEHRDIAIKEPFIQNHHIESLSNLVMKQDQSSQREVLHCIPVSFSIDGREAIQNPLNFSGEVLKGQFFVIDSDRNYLKDIIRLCNLCGLEILQFYSEPYASSCVTVDEKLKQMGVVVADIGGGTTDGIVFQNGRPVEMFTINIAGSLMTSDISLGLNVDTENAESLKKTWGLSNHQKNLSVMIKDIHGKDQKIESSELRAILGPRVCELGAHLANNLKSYKGFLKGGVLFTGGGSNLHGLEDFLSHRFQVSVRRSQPDFKLITKAESYHARYATVMGILSLEMARNHLKMGREYSSWPKKYFGQFFNWMKELAE